MEIKEIINELEQIFKEVLKKDNVSLQPESSANTVDGWDSLTNMLIISAIEKKYGIKFGFREIVKMKNIDDLCKGIIKKKE